MVMVRLRAPKVAAGSMTRNTVAEVVLFTVTPLTATPVPETAAVMPDNSKLVPVTLTDTVAGKLYVPLKRAASSHLMIGKVFDFLPLLPT